MIRYTNQYNYPNYWLVNPVGLSGCLFLMWKDGISVEVVDSNRNFIVCLANFDARSEIFLLICMYGALDVIGIGRQWDFLSSLSGKHKCPWLIMGDLNFVVSKDEKLGGNTFPQSHIDEVNDHLDFLDLTDIVFSGNTFTWSNKRNDASVIFERIDRALGNDRWLDCFPNCIVYHLLAFGSDHCPILLVSAKEENTTRKPYKFNKCWFLNDSCKELVSANWNSQDRGSHAFRLTRSLHNVKDVLRNWNLNTFGNIQTQLKLVQDELAIVNTNNADKNLPSRTELEDKLKYWYDVQHEFYMQRAKENILSYDDGNTKYLHDKVKFRKRRTQIDSIQSEIGVRITDRDSIASELKRHFSNICRSKNPPSPDSLLDNIESCISDEDNDALLSSPSTDEIKQVVFQMQPWTSPGPDGYHLVFTRKCGMW